MYGVCVTVLSLCLVYSVQPFFQYISVPEFPSCLLISSNCIFTTHTCRVSWLQTPASPGTVLQRANTWGAHQ